MLSLHHHVNLEFIFHFSFLFHFFVSSSFLILIDYVFHLFQISCILLLFIFFFIIILVVVYQNTMFFCTRLRLFYVVAWFEKMRYWHVLFRLNPSFVFFNLTMLVKILTLSLMKKSRHVA